MRKTSDSRSSPLDLPEVIESEETLEEVMTRPPATLVESLSRMEGDLMILGVGGKMGPTLARLAMRAFEECDGRRVIGVSRFKNPEAKKKLERHGVETLECDFLEPEEVQGLPEVPNVIFMAGLKFGTTGAEAATWALNSLAPGYVGSRFRNSRIVVLSTGNVYPLSPVDGDGPTEEKSPGPVGEYAQSALARERIFEYISGKFGAPVCIIRLNYAIDLRYGVLLDIAQKVYQNRPIDLSMGHVNLIWQGDANRQILQSFEYVSSPPAIFNVTGADMLSVREIAKRFGDLFGRDPVFVGSEAGTALLSNPAKANKTFGPPTVSLEKMIQWVSHWVSVGGPTLDKPTHFETRDGRF